ncbi:MAG: HEAT repeat domain-containing protein [Candidatus Heimdallarchaeota archaeon]|nr:HEAT repeat domain-containing protein [Candidatus Heimdallarchaeota archaeon]MDH5645754.1 HEAT repeat domain-containing protein [Candidatus Heimdallarchaeota archaeon]
MHPLLDQSLSAERRIQACFQLQNEEIELAVELLSQGLFTDPSPIVRHECAYTLGEISTPQSIKSLIHAIETDSNDFVVHEAALALSNLGEGAQYFQNLLKSNNLDIVCTAEISLQRMKMKKNQQSIEDFTSSYNSLIMDLHKPAEHRIQAAFKLMKEGSESSITQLISAMKQESDPIVKHEIIFSLGETASIIAAEALAQELEKDANLFVIHESLLALGTLGYPDYLPIISSFLEHEHADIKESAEIAIERLQS